MHVPTVLLMAAGRLGVTDQVTAADGAPVGIATHGMVMTTWLVSRGALARRDADEFRSDLQFPDCFVLSADGHTSDDGREPDRRERCRDVAIRRQ